MFRRFEFEKEFNSTLEFIPMSMRRKLDLVGVKMHLNEWQALSMTERLAACHLPAASAEEREVLGNFLREAVKRRTGNDAANVKPVTEESGPDAGRVPADVLRLISELQLRASEWGRFDSDERFALSKLARGPAEKFRSAWAEIAGAAGSSKSAPAPKENKEAVR
ncbi:MAG TPA: nitrate reductase associated protein [Candidatus Binataceae bacterium]|nr:nitrate reductase associated protein [Candidatus Binataceae bacterium]